MNEEMKEAIVEAFEDVFNTMGAVITEDVKKYGVDIAIRRFQMSVEGHAREHGTWDKMNDVERPAGMLWAAAELLVGAMISAGVWLDE